jgi:polygalacturonase
MTVVIDRVEIDTMAICTQSKMFPFVMRLLVALFIAFVARPARAQPYAVPTVPSIGSTIFDLSQANGGVGGASIDNGATLIGGVSGSSSTNSSNAAANTTLINDAIAYASSNGGGVVMLPANSGSVTYLANELMLANNVNLDVATNATLQNETTTGTFITAAPTATGNVEISGGGIINSNATSTSNNKMVALDGLTNVEVTNVTLENAPNEHLVTEDDSNVTINNVTIHDSKIQSNTDGIDFSGTNILIQGCTIADGDDDIVAKPDTSKTNGITAYTANVLIQNCTITAGHGISIGGQTNAGLNGMYVTNITENATGTTALQNGIHLKAGDGTTSTTENGGLVENVTFNGITMTNVDDAIAINSFYNNGSDNYPKIATYPTSPSDLTEPFWENVTLENITVNSATGSAAEIYGLDSSPLNTAGLNFENIDVVESDSAWKMYYGSNIFMNDVYVGGANILDQEGDYKNTSGTTESDEADDTFVLAGGASPIYTPALAPEPASAAMIGGLVVLRLARRRRR